MEVVQSLRSVESFLHREWPRLWHGYEYRRKREVHLLSFRVESPPDFKILTDPAWLAVFLTILAGYKSMKENVREIRNDTSKLLEAVRGLTGRELQLLEIAVRLSLERIAELGEQHSLKFARLCHRTRAALLGGEEGLPKIEVINIEKDTHW